MIFLRVPFRLICFETFNISTNAADNTLIHLSNRKVFAYSLLHDTRNKYILFLDIFNYKLKGPEKYTYENNIEAYRTHSDNSK